MTRTYGVNKDYAIERALAHTTKYGRAHVCMVFQRSKFDETMTLALPEVEQQTIIEIDDWAGSYSAVIKAALGIGKQPTESSEEIPF